MCCCAHLAVSPHAIARVLLELMHVWPIATPISGRDPKETRPCRDTKTISRHQFFQAVSRHQKVCRDTTSTHPATSVSRHHEGQLCRNTMKANRAATPRSVSRHQFCQTRSRHQKVCSDTVPAWPKLRALSAHVVG